MNCTKCGAEIYRGDRFCAACGAPIREGAPTVPTPRDSRREAVGEPVRLPAAAPYRGSHAAPRAAAHRSAPALPQIRIPRPDALPLPSLSGLRDPRSLVGWGAVFLWLLQILFLFVKSIQLSVLGFVSREMANFSIGEYWIENDFAGVLTVIAGLSVASLVLTLLPLLYPKKGRLTLLVLPKISAVLCVLFWYVTWLGTKDVSRRAYELASFHHNAIFWLYLINAIGLLVLSFVISGRSVRQRRAVRSAQDVR